MNSGSLLLIPYFVTGTVLGGLYFLALWWTARKLGVGGRVGTAMAVTALRIVVLGGFMILASRRGAMPLLTMALGVMLARAVVLRRLKAIAA